MCVCQGRRGVETRTRDSLWVSEEGGRRGLKILHETSGQRGEGRRGVENGTRHSGTGRLNKSWGWGWGRGRMSRTL